MRNINLAGDPERAARWLLDVAHAVGRSRSLRDPLTHTLEQSELTPAQIHALLWLGKDHALTMGELAQRLGITEKTVTGVVDRLERDRFLTRVRSSADRRVVRAVLTRKGRGVYRKIQERLLSKMTWVMSLLSSAQRRGLIEIIEGLVKKVGESDAAKGAA